MLYLYHYKEAIPKIKEYLGDIPIILVLRDPVNRAYSNYHYQGRGQINDFEKALELEEQRKNKSFCSLWYYKETGMYYEPVKAYLENFSKVKVFLFEDLIADPKSFMGETYDFLGAEKSFSPRANPLIQIFTQVLIAQRFRNDSKREALRSRRSSNLVHRPILAKTFSMLCLRR